MGIFRFNSPLMTLLGKVANYVFLYILSFVCSIPIITAGASTTAKYYVAMKMIRGEEPAVWKPFFTAFKQNFKQATIIWMIEILIVVIFVFDWNYMLQVELSQIGQIIKIALLVLTVFCVLAGIAAFPLIARYEMSVGNIMKAAFIFVFLHPFRMIFVLFWMVAPIYLAVRFPNWFIGIWPLVPTLGMFISAGIFMKQFSKIEKKKEELSGKTQTSEGVSEEGIVTEGETVNESEHVTEAEKAVEGEGITESEHAQAKI